MRRLLLLAAVGLVAADSSIVVLAVPDLLARFGGSIGATAWTITGYNVAACATAALLSAVHVRRSLLAGLLVFALGTGCCAAAPSLALLIALRSLQGIGAGLVLAGAIAAIGTPRVAAASVAGLAVGPALGGFLTEAFDWRAIFVVQVPVALAALAVLPREHARASERARLRSAVALGLASAALVAVLFLVVLLLIDGHGLSPLAAAAVVTLLPAAGVFAQRVVTAPPAAGIALLTAGLALLAPATGSLLLIGAAVIVCGAGLGLSLAPLSADAGLAGVAARHGGVVLGLLLITPPLAHDLDANARRAVRDGAVRVVRADVPLVPKTVLGVRLYEQLRRPDEGRLPDFGPAFDRTAAAFPRAAPALRALERQLVSAERRAVADSFMRTFELATLLSACALLAAMGATRRRSRAAGDGLGRSIGSVAREPSVPR